MPFDRARYYSSPAVLRQYHESGLDRKRSDFVLSDGSMPMSSGWAKYRRFHPAEAWIFVTAPDGGHWITEKQALVLRLAESIIDSRLRLTMHQMAERLEVATSTVSRALCKFAAWGLIAYIPGRGRWAGLVMFRRVKDDGLDRFRKAAKERVRRWAKAAEDRVSRLKINVASYIPWREIEAHGLADYYLSPMVATLNEPWEIAEDARA
jgi:predicted transcriptional regulator